ncbi:hypothetical protein [Streptomyces axinellae]|uniref:Secreted protein n=1 Tax=Streptomyces axinellae TaxID=552788 RepID=A0ABP6D7G8_9ACTN
MKRTHHIKLLVAVTVVLLTLSGFSPNRSSGGRGGSSSSGGKVHSGGGGGGCSSKSSSSHSGSSDYDSSSSSGSSSSGGYDSSSSSSSSSSGGYGGSGGHRAGTRYNSTTGSTNSGSSSNGSGSSRRDGSGSVVKCADSAAPSATVRVRNAASRQATYTVSVKFVDDLGTTVDTGSAVVTLAANGTKSVKVPMSNPSEVGDVNRCEVLSVR